MSYISLLRHSRLFIILAFKLWHLIIAGYLITLWNPELCYLLKRPVSTCGVAQLLAHTFNPLGWNTENLSAHLLSQTMKLKLVCKRKHPCLKVMSNWVADKVMDQRKLWQNRLCPTFTGRRMSGKLLNGQCRNRRGGSSTGMHRDRLQGGTN